MDNRTKEVRFDLYCKDCEHLQKKETEEPCNDCLAHGWNYDSYKPMFFKDKTSSDK